MTSKEYRQQIKLEDERIFTTLKQRMRLVKTMPISHRLKAIGYSWAAGNTTFEDFREALDSNG